MICNLLIFFVFVLLVAKNTLFLFSSDKRGSTHLEQNPKFILHSISKLDQVHFACKFPLLVVL